MRAVIPVAGIGTRLKPHTYSTPKVLLNVGGKPILGHILDKLTEEGLTKSTFIIGYLGEMIKEYVEREYPDLLLHIFWIRKVMMLRCWKRTILSVAR